jgi:hypothetical protein
LILNFVKKDGVDSQNIRTRDPDSIERSKPEPLQDGRTKKKNRQ